MATDIFKKGESVNSFAQRVGFTPAELRALNPNAFRSAGETINLPDAPQAPQQNSPPTQQSNQQTSQQTAQPEQQPAPQPAQQPNQGGSPLGTQIANEAALQERREELTKAGITDFSQFISSPDQDPLGRGRLFFRQPVTLTKDGQTRTVAAGSDEANALLRSGFISGTQFDSSNIDSDTLREESKIDTGGVEGDKFPSTSTQAAIATATETSKAINDAISEITSERDAARDEISDLLGQLEGSEELRTQKLEEQGVSEFEKNLKNIRAEINIRTAELQQQLAEEEATPQTLARMTGGKNAATRKAQADLMFLNAQAQATMGNIEFAYDMAQKAVDAKYNPILEQISIKQQQLAILEADADKDTQLFISSLNSALAQQQADIQELKAQEIDIQNTYLTALQEGISDQSVLNQIKNAKTSFEAKEIMLTNMPQEFIGGGGGTGGTGDGGDGITEEPLSINKIDQFRRNFGWTPPYGFTESQLQQFMKDNPNATPAELEVGAKQVLVDSGIDPVDTTNESGNTDDTYLSGQYFRDKYSKDELKTMADKAGLSKWYTPASVDITRFLSELETKIEEARASGYSDYEIEKFITQ